MTGKDNKTDHQGLAVASGTGDETANMYSIKWNSQLKSLQASLATLLDSRIATDAFLCCQGAPLPAHKIVLIAASPFIASIVQKMNPAHNMMPAFMVDIPEEAGEALLSFLYLGEARASVTMLPHLVHGAKLLGIPGFGDPDVLESLTSIEHESTFSRDITQFPSRKFQLPIVTSHLASSGEQMSKCLGDNKSKRKSSVCTASSETAINNESKNNRDLFQSEAEDYSGAKSRLHNNSAANTIPQQREGNLSGYHSSPLLSGMLRHPAFANEGNYGDDNVMEMTMADEDMHLPSHLLEPSVEVTVSQETPERYGLTGLPNVCQASSQKQSATFGKQRSKKNQQQAEYEYELADKTSIGEHTRAPAVTLKRPKTNPHSTRCEICGEAITNAYDMRLHMEGHSGHLFLCSVCGHNSKTLDALRKHFTSSHSELSVSGMHAYNTNVPGKKYEFLGS